MTNYLKKNTTVDWKIGLYDRNANAVTSAPLVAGEPTDEFIRHPTDLKWTMPLNGIDTFEFSVLLDDPVAAHLFTKTRYVRVWRYINDTAASISVTPNTGTPDFCGVITAINRTASNRKVTVTCQSPLWLLQTHFHILNHRLVTDTSSFGGSDFEGGNANDLAWDHSALMFRLIDLINGAFKASGGDTGIRRPTTRLYSGSGYLAGKTLYWPQTIKVSPFYVQKGAYTWPLIMEDLMSRAASPDIIPEYIYSAGSINKMYFRTSTLRGSVSGITLGYRTGNNAIEDLTEQIQVIPGEYANYIWVVGDGGPNGGFVSEADDTASMATNGIFMSRQDVQGAKGVDTDTLADDKLPIALLADSPIYSVTLAPEAASQFYFNYHYGIGDLINLSAVMGTYNFTNKPQRIYSATLSFSDNNIEKVELQISNDFKRKYAP